jgi:VWFA-related protein
MHETRIKSFTALLFLLLALITAARAQSGRVLPSPTPPEDDSERVFTEEIKLNILAFDRNGEFYAGVGKEDVVVTEDGVLHQPTSVRRMPANVLIVLDTGGEERQAKDIRKTRAAAKALVGSLKPDDTVALLEYNDQARILAEWTSDKTQLMTALDKNLNFGKRSRFVEALNLSVGFFAKSAAENRHLILITDGLDSTASQTERDAAIRQLLATDINVHVISYTKMEQSVVEQRARSVRGGGTQRKELPPGADIPVQGQTKTYPVMTINLDRAMMRKIRERGENLEKSETALTTLAENTNGEIFLPETKDEMIEKTGLLARTIDSQYVVTYTPKRPLSEAANGEIRSIQATSKRSGLDVQGRRKLAIVKKP